MDLLGITLRLLLLALGAYLGALASSLLQRAFSLSEVGNIANTIYLMLAGLMTAFLFSGRFEALGRVVFAHLTSFLGHLEPKRVTAGTVGAIMGLLVSVLLSNLLANAPFYTWFVSALITLALVSFFIYFTLANADFFGSVLSGTPTPRRAQVTNAKVLDTNVIIDGRITDLVKAGFLEGNLVVPVFVLRELQFIADQGDATKRARGRRGLEVLEVLRTMTSLTVLDWDAPDLSGVDDKLVRLTKELGGKLVSNDYNLNKVARLQDLEVLNINELATAIRPKYAAGDSMTVTISKEGQQPGQGVAYLEDGTMVVVEDGQGHRGKSRKVVVLSNIQTAVGRMIFAKLDE
ncbi:uncharacterized protein YacL [Deinobacterium chartae]|uniref:Uncharacterized protein YacL n=1 Tax=Deinobacterium chartae TaxID=521158 RepID=A0A841I2C2_9DEIO|nr:PIN domain-containing protein [Deinobacterium chartae]MBB6098560.1 uncharacterized protein YacL [Deinobacterium chartae]